MKQRIINDSFWTDPYIEDLDPSEKLVFLYLLTNPLCNIAWIYEIQPRRMAFETWFDKDMIEKILERFVNDNKILRVDNWVVIKNFAKNQSTNPNVVKGMQRIIDSLPEKVKACKGFDSLSHFTLLNLTIPNLTTHNSKEGENFSNFPIINNSENIFKTIDNKTVLEKYEINEEELEEEIQLFINYWTAIVKKWKKENIWKELWQTKETFEPNRRFATWLSNNKKWNKKKSNNTQNTWVVLVDDNF